MSSENLDLVIVTGLSGAGRSTVANALENVGYYVVDNLPQALLVPMANLALEAGDDVQHTAVVLDVRSRAFSTDLLHATDTLTTSGFTPRVLFVEASDAVLIQRFESVRREHPLQGTDGLAEGIEAERKLLADARARADVVIDTTHLNQNELRVRVEDLFSPEGRATEVTVLTFGFKHGAPSDADLVLDMRFVVNPHWVPQLREHTGLDDDVSEYVLSQEGVREFLDTYTDLILTMIPGYRREGKKHVTLAVGCTGGRHRSVASAEYIAATLQHAGVHAHTVHRDMVRR